MDKRTGCIDSYTGQFSLAIQLGETIVHDELGVSVQLIGSCHSHLVIVRPETIATVKTL